MKKFFEKGLHIAIHFPGHAGIYHDHSIELIPVLLSLLFHQTSVKHQNLLKIN